MMRHYEIIEINYRVEYDDEGYTTTYDHGYQVVESNGIYHSSVVETMEEAKKIMAAKCWG